MSEDKPIQFLGSFPPIGSAIKVSGNGDGMRIQIDVPESEMGNALKLLLLRECVLEVTIKQADDRQNRQQNSRQSTY